MVQPETIEPAKTDWASPSLFTPIKNCTLQFCADYRECNAVTGCYSYPILRMDECIEWLGYVTIFSTLDANSGYWQIQNCKKIHGKDLLYVASWIILVYSCAVLDLKAQWAHCNVPRTSFCWQSIGSLR